MSSPLRLLPLVVIVSLAAPLAAQQAKPKSTPKSAKAMTGA